MIVLDDLNRTIRRCLDLAGSSRTRQGSPVVTDLVDAILWHVDIFGDRGSPQPARIGGRGDPAAVVVAVADVLIRHGVALTRADGTVIDCVEPDLIADLAIEPPAPFVDVPMDAPYVVQRGSLVGGHARPGDTVHYLASDCLDDAPYRVVDSRSASRPVDNDAAGTPITHCLSLYRLRRIGCGQEVLSDLAGRGWAHADVAPLDTDTDFFELGLSAHNHGLPRVPAMDANVVRAHTSLVPTHGDPFAQRLRREWLEGWAFGEMVNPGTWD